MQWTNWSIDLNKLQRKVCTKNIETYFISQRIFVFLHIEVELVIRKQLIFYSSLEKLIRKLIYVLGKNVVDETYGTNQGVYKTERHVIIAHGS